MGLYDTVSARGIQVKCVNHDEPTMEHYGVGDGIELADGVYIGYEGWFVVEGGKILIAGADIYDKWGCEIDKCNLLTPSNPIAGALRGSCPGEEV